MSSRLRIPHAYNAMIGRIAALAGAIPTQIEVPDLPNAFATGRVDVMITSASTGVGTKSQDYLTHYIDTQAWLPRNIVFVNKESFDKLTPAEQKAVIDAGKVAEDRGWKMSIATCVASWSLEPVPSCGVRASSRRSIPGSYSFSPGDRSRSLRLRLPTRWRGSPGRCWPREAKTGASTNGGLTKS